MLWRNKIVPLTNMPLACNKYPENEIKTFFLKLFWVKEFFFIEFLFSKSLITKIWPNTISFPYFDYRVIHVSLTFLIWLKMTLPCIEDMKERHFYSPEDPPFDMKHQLMSADSLPVVKIDLSRKVNFHYFFFHFYTIWEFFPKPFFLLVWAWTSNFSSFMMHESHFLGFWESLFLNISNFDETIKNWQNWQIGTSF